jgi:UDP-glucose 4-epimerase
MNILVTGGAGYIGSHIVYKLVNQHNVFVYDNLSNGHEEFVHKKATLINADLKDKDELDKTFKKYNIDAVIHLAAYALVGESMQKPKKYFQNNIVNGLNLLNAMVENNVKNIIFSSSAAVYGSPKEIPLKEEFNKKPTNVYGETKLFFEKILEWYKTIHKIKYVSLRYFNAAGSNGNIGEDHDPETHLIPLILQAALGQIPEIKIFGTDYPTKDGTCIRDYIHVDDLADAHILALNKEGIYNLGNNKGHSIKEIIDLIKEITKKDFKVVETNKRAGDPPILVASHEKIKKELGWEPELGIKEIIKSAWDWHSKSQNTE